MLSQEAELALGRLAEGAVMNPVHTVARELIDAGLAMNDWGRLALTEAGRTRIRKPHRRYYDIIDEHVCDMSMYQNPMGLGPEVPTAVNALLSAAADAPPAPAPVVEHVKHPKPESYYDRATQAAGIASGKTGEWPTSEWVHAFMDAFNENQ